MKSALIPALVSLVAVAASAIATQTADQKVSDLAVKPGRTTSVTGNLTGHGHVDYRIRASAGEVLSVVLKPTVGSPNFNILPPGSQDVAMFIGGFDGLAAAKRLPDDGTYTIRVYQDRAASRRGDKATFSLRVSLDGTALRPITGDAVLKGTPFHASTIATCKLAVSPDVDTCQAFVVRRGRDVTGTVVFKSEKVTRRVLFVKGQLVASDSAVRPTHARNGDDHIVTFGAEESYTFNEALLTGG